MYFTGVFAYNNLMNLYRSYPPYEGEKAYLFLCFSDSDAALVRPFLDVLYRRGCRVWYSLGKTADLSEHSFRQSRMSHAALTVLYLTDQARKDVDVKSEVLFCQAREQPVICLDTDQGDSGLSMGLTDQVHHVQDVQELIRTEGFTQELIGSPRAPAKRGLKKAVLVLAVLTICLVAAGFAGWHFFGWFHSETDYLSDPALKEVVQDVVLAGISIQERLQEVDCLHLNRLPEHKEDLSVFPHLTRLEIPQSEAQHAQEFLDDYTVVLYGAGES